MSARLDFYPVSPKLMAILSKQEQQLSQQFSQSETLNITTWELVKLRVSQINKCAYCIDMHTKDAFHQGETAERIIGLSAWSDMLCYSTVESSALAWAELMVSNNAISEEQYLATLNVLGEQAIFELSVAINAINAWNKIVKAFKPEVGSYEVDSHKTS